MKTDDATPSCRVVRLITRLNIGGPAQQALLLTRELGADYPTVLGAGAPAATEGELRDESIPVNRLPLVRQFRPRTDVRAVAAVRALIDRYEPQLVHTHTAKAGSIGRIAAITLGRRRPRLVHTFHGHVLDGYFSPRIQRYFVEVERRLARHTDLLIAVSPQVRDDLLSLGVGIPEQYRVIPVGLDLRPFSEDDHIRGGLRAQLGLDRNTPLIGAVGRLVPIKDIGTLMAAIALLPEVHVAFLGDGESRQHLEARAMELQISERAHFLGWYPDVARAMRDFDVVALTSHNEGTPVAIIEALAAGRPVVATSVGGVGFVIQDGITGLLARKSDPVGIADRIRRVLADPLGAHIMAAAGQRDVMERFAYPRLVSDIGDLYGKLIGP